MGTHGRDRFATGPITSARPAPPREPTGPLGRASHAAPASAWRSRLPLVLAAVGGVLLLGAGLVAGWLLAPRSSAATAAASPAAVTANGTTTDASGLPAAAATHPTLFGSVTRVDTGDEVVVNVAGTEVTVAILGVEAPQLPGAGSSGECGAQAALKFADQTLSGQTVTLVPDPTVPATDDQGRRLAYVVLPSQLSYTDAALLGGIARADTSRKLWYAPVFDREQTQAIQGAKGLWGAPCRAEPGQPLRGGT